MRVYGKKNDKNFHLETVFFSLANLCKAVLILNTFKISDSSFKEAIHSRDGLLQRLILLGAYSVKVCTLFQKFYMYLECF